MSGIRTADLRGGRQVCYHHDTLALFRNYKSSFFISVKPTGLDLEIGEAVKENTLQSVECKVNSANPASSVGMVLVIDGVNQTEIEPDVTETHGSDNGMVKTFVFMFTTERSQNEKMVECRLLWDGTFIEIKKEQSLNITCE